MVSFKSSGHVIQILEGGGHIDPPPGETGVQNRPGEIGLKMVQINSAKKSQISLRILTGTTFSEFILLITDNTSSFRLKRKKK